MSEVPVDLRGVAALLGKSLNWTHRHIRRLRDQHGFPAPLPLIRRYDPIAIRAWIARQSLEAPSANADELDWAERLDANAVSLSKVARKGR